MIWDWTDSIFKWNFWKFFKWIFGSLILIGLLCIIWILNVEGEERIVNTLQHIKFSIHSINFFSD